MKAHLHIGCTGLSSCFIKLWVFLLNFSRKIAIPLTKIKAFMLVFGVKENTLGTSIDISSFFNEALGDFILSSLNGNI